MLCLTYMKLNKDFHSNMFFKVYSGEIIILFFIHFMTNCPCLIHFRPDSSCFIPRFVERRMNNGSLFVHDVGHQTFLSSDKNKNFGYSKLIEICGI